MANIDNNNKMLETHRAQLKSVLNTLLERADEIVETAYRNDALGVSMSIEMDFVQLVTYTIKYSLFSIGDFQRKNDFWNDIEVDENGND